MMVLAVFDVENGPVIMLADKPTRLSAAAVEFDNEDHLAHDLAKPFVKLTLREIKPKNPELKRAKHHGTLWVRAASIVSLSPLPPMPGAGE